MKKQQNIPRLIFSLMGLISAVIILILVGYVIFLMQNEVFKALNALFIAFSSTIFSFIVMLFLDKKRIFLKKLQRKKYNYSWLAIFLISSSFGLIAFIYYLTAAEFALIPGDIDFDFDNPANLNFIVFLICSVTTNISAYLIYFSLKNLHPKLEFQKKKFGVYASVTTLLFIILSVGLIYAYDNFFTFPDPTIINGTGFNDGPWLTWEDDPKTTMTISWLTAEENVSYVYYGEDAGNLDQIYSDNEELYLHHAKLTGLTPDTEYFYKIPEEFSQDHESTLFNFTTAPSTPRDFRFAVFGDVQPTDLAYSERNQKVADGLINGSFDFILNTGDLADDGQDLNDWHLMMLSFARTAANTPIQASIGNHDWDGSLGSSNWGEVFPYPYASPDSGRFFSFDYLSAHFVMIDNFQHQYVMTPKQMNWIKNDITTARNNDPDCWVFCFFHLSMMTTATSGHYFDLQAELVPLFDQLDVDAVFFGHDHHYEHYEYTYGETKNGYLWNKNHNWDHNDIHYFCTGAGGANLEVSYGVLNANGMTENVSVNWYDQGQEKYVTKQYEKRNWDSTKYVEHADFSINYTTGGGHDGKYYYHDSNIEIYDEFAQEIGFDYGEQCYQFMQLEINAAGDQCTISARYPNGVLISGPGGVNPQIWTLYK
ncbi:MAG: hypothetical protein GF364_19375 [Candidatus Lokiarchaeota archaeon]|nr:hypothetical protein [Candidatus Lokiarchaeota archaeon]